MLTDTGPLQLAQFGPRSECCGSNPRNSNFLFWANGNCVGCPQDWAYLPASAENSVHEYKVTYNPLDGQVKFWLDGQKVGYSHPLYAITWTPHAVQTAGEISNQVAQMFGCCFAMGNFTGGQYRLGDSSVAWSTATGHRMYYGPAHFGITGTASNFGIWDTCV
jgi:hypothetical protein